MGFAEVPGWKAPKLESPRSWKAPELESRLCGDLCLIGVCEKTAVDSRMDG